MIVTGFATPFNSIGQVMTSPIKSPEKQKCDKKSPIHSVGQPEKRTVSRAPTPTANNAHVPIETFSCLRVFRLADLMTKQGC